jgi:hypothetical protein
MAATRTAEAPSFFPLGVWYEGGVGEFRTNLIPEDPNSARPLYEANFKDIADHGLSVVVAPNSTPPHHRTLLDAAQRHGLKVILELGREGGELGSWIRGTDPYSKEAMLKVLNEKLAPIAEHPALFRVQLLDEPWKEIFGRYGQVADEVRGFAPSKPPFCCIIEADNVGEFLRKTESDVVAFDCYPIGASTPIGDRAALSRFEAVAAKAAVSAAEYRADAWAVIQCHAITNVHRFPTPAEVRCMTHLALAAGCKGIFWFLYQTEWLDKGRGIVMEGLTDWEYRERSNWREIRDLTSRIRKIAPILSRLRPLDMRGALLATGAAAYCLTDHKGAYYGYLVNRDTLKGITVKARLNANLFGDRAAVFSEPGGQKVALTERDFGLEFTLNLVPGDGALFRIVPAWSSRIVN